MGNNEEVGVEEGVVLEQLDSHEMVEFGGKYCVRNGGRGTGNSIGGSGSRCPRRNKRIGQG